MRRMCIKGKREKAKGKRRQATVCISRTEIERLIVLLNDKRSVATAAQPGDAAGKQKQLN